MRSQTYGTIDQSLPSPGQTFSDDSVLLNRKLANITSLVSSLNAAVHDLEAVEVPPFTDQFDFYNEVQRFESGLIKTALRLTGGSQVKAARLLKLNPTTLNAKIKALGLFAKANEQLL